MNRRIVLFPVLAIGLIVFLVGCEDKGGTASSEPMASEIDFETAITTVRTQFTKAVGQSDGAAVAALHTADAKTYSPDGTTRNGTEEIAAGYQGMFDTGIDSTLIEPIESIEYSDWGWEIGTYTYTGQSAEGEPLFLMGEYTVLMMKVDGMWKMHRTVAFDKREPPSEEDTMASDEPMPMTEEGQGMVPEGIQAGIDRFTEAIAQGDAAAVAAIYTAQAHLYNSDGTMSSGTEAITANYQELADMGFKAVTIEPVETIQQGDRAWQLGRYTFTGESAEGAALMGAGEYATLLTQEAGVWKMHRNIAFPTRKAPLETMTSDVM